jgi:hypothetical protein
MTQLTPEQSQARHSQAVPLFLGPKTQKVDVAASSQVDERIQDLLLNGNDEFACFLERAERDAQWVPARTGTGELQCHPVEMSEPPPGTGR